MTVGVLAIQGDFEAHLRAFRSLDCTLDLQEVRTPEDLAKVDRLVIPGGESTTVGLLMERFGVGDALCERAKDGMPIWGTCMGMILLAREVEEREQYLLGLLDIRVQRNAFGAQVHSFEDEVLFEPLEKKVTGVFIRAPIVTWMGPEVEAIAHYEGKVVGVRQGRILGTSFHPELTDDTTLHEWFLSL